MIMLEISLTGFLLSLFSGYMLHRCGTAEIVPLTGLFLFFAGYAGFHFLPGEKKLLLFPFAVCCLFLNCIVFHFMPMLFLSGSSAALLMNEMELKSIFRRKWFFAVGFIVGAFFAFTGKTFFCTAIQFTAFSLILIHLLMQKRKIFYIIASILAVLMLFLFPRHPASGNIRNSGKAAALVAQLQVRPEFPRIYSAGINAAPIHFNLQNIHISKYSDWWFPACPLLSASPHFFDVIQIRLNPPFSFVTDQIFSTEMLKNIREKLDLKGVFAVCIHEPDPFILSVLGARIGKVFPTVQIYCGISGMILASERAELTMSPDLLDSRALKSFGMKTYGFFRNIAPLLGKRVEAMDFPGSISLLSWERIPPAPLIRRALMIRKGYLVHPYLYTGLLLLFYLFLRYFLIGTQSRKTGCLLFENGLWFGGMTIFLLLLLMHGFCMPDMILPLLFGILLMSSAIFSLFKAPESRIGYLLLPLAVPPAFLIFHSAGLFLLCIFLSILTVFVIRNAEFLKGCASASWMLPLGFAAALPLFALLLTAPGGLWLAACLLSLAFFSK